MAVATKSQGELLDWTNLDETVGVESDVIGSGQGYDTSIQAMLHIVMAHKDNNANTGTPGCVVFVRVSGTDEGWREHIRFRAKTATSNQQALDANSGSGQGNPERIEVAATANFDGIGDVIFLRDAGTLADSTLVAIKDFVTNDYIVSMDDLVNAYDSSDLVFDVVDEWSVVLPTTTDEAKVLFFNDDADSEFACRVDYSLLDTVG